MRPRHDAIVGAARAVACLCVATLIASCGGSKPDPQANHPPTDATIERTVRPPTPQLLAFVTTDAVWVLDGKARRRLVPVPEGSEVHSLQWSGDGRQIAFIVSDNSYAAGRLTMVDAASGKTRSWVNVSGGLAPSPTGVTIGGYENKFEEFLPDGRRVGHRVTVAGSKSGYRDPNGPTTTVAFAVPLGGSWLVAAESTTRSGTHGSPHRLFFQDPVSGALTLVGADEHTYAAREVLRLDDDHVLWVAESSGGACDSYNNLVGFGRRTPDLPERADGAWEIRRLAAGPSGIEAVVRPLTGGFVEGTSDCTADDLTYIRMTLRDGRWVKTDDDIVDLSKAADGRVATVRATHSGLREEVALPDLQFQRAEVTAAGKTVTQLPRDTRAVRFSPAGPMRLREVRTGSRQVLVGDTLTETGIGPLHLGADASALQRALATPLQIDGDRSGCGTMRFGDTSVENTTGVIGHMVDGRLDWLEVTSRDTPVGYGEPLSDLQPDVQAIAPRGPKTSKGAQAGKSVDRLLSGHGEPIATTQLPNDAIEYVFAEGSATLVARVDAAGTIRRLELRRGRHRGRCVAART